jgi:hypothetical protein
LNGFNALSPLHLALPRAVGPYSVVRTTRRFKTDDKVILFGSFATDADANGNTPAWLNVCAISSAVPAAAINGANASYVWTYDTSSFGVAMTWVPAAITVQIMNPGALQTTSGMVYGGRVHTQLPLANDARTWDSLSDSLIQYQTPRLMSAGKLALKGVKCSALPFDMSDLTDFRAFQATSTGAITWDGDTSVALAHGAQPSGFAPIFVVNTGDSLELEYLVTCEWRLRFDPNTPACSAHTFHPPAPLSVWNDAVAAAMRGGHGMEDIADAVADTGLAIGQAILDMHPSPA